MKTYYYYLFFYIENETEVYVVQETFASWERLKPGVSPELPNPGSSLNQYTRIIINYKNIAQLTWHCKSIVFQ